MVSIYEVYDVPTQFWLTPPSSPEKDPKGPVQIGLTEHYLIWLRGRGVMQQLQRKERLYPWQKLGNHKFTSWTSLSKWSRFLLQSRQVSWVSGIWKEMIANTRFRKTPHRTTGNQGIVFQWLIPSILSLLLLFATNKIQTQGREYKVYLVTDSHQSRQPASVTLKVSMNIQNLSTRETR